MNEVKHTPAPWTLETVKTSVGVCHKIGPLGSSTKIHNACLYDDYYSSEPRDLVLLADAKLILAAPELLEALKDVRNYFWSREAESPILTEGDVMSLVEAVIAKAEGR